MFNDIKNILFLGPMGTNAQIAANKFIEKLNIKAELEPVYSISRMLLKLNENKNLLAVSPIENSIEGIVRETLDNTLLLSDDIYIISQTVIPISHALISFGNKEDIKTIMSHPQAISQCRNYIRKNFNNDISLISTSSTSSAVIDLVNKDKTYGAIGNELCARLYNVPILDQNISDIKENYTRFALIGKKPSERLVENRTSIVFSTKNEPGALLRVLQIFKEYNLNMVYLESRPNKITPGEYNFFVDIDKGIDEISDAILKIEKYCCFFRLLGSYSVL